MRESLNKVLFTVLFTVSANKVDPQNKSWLHSTGLYSMVFHCMATRQTENCILWPWLLND